MKNRVVDGVVEGILLALSILYGEFFSLDYLQKKEFISLKPIETKLSPIKILFAEGQ